jgi:hypothetical protein
MAIPLPVESITGLDSTIPGHTKSVVGAALSVDGNGLIAGFTGANYVRYAAAALTAPFTICADLDVGSSSKRLVFGQDGIDFVGWYFEINNKFVGINAPAKGFFDFGQLTGTGIKRVGIAFGVDSAQLYVNGAAFGAPIEVVAPLVSETGLNTIGAALGESGTPGQFSANGTAVGNHRLYDQQLTSLQMAEEYSTYISSPGTELTANIMLAPLTSTSAASLAINAASNKTLAPLTSSAAADIGAVSISAAVNVTLAPLTSASAASLAINAASNKTLAPLTSSAAASLAINALSNKTLAPLTSNASMSIGTPPISASVTSTLQPLTSSSNASTSISASAGVTFSPLTTTSIAVLKITAISNKMLQPLTSLAAMSVGVIEIEPGVIAVETPAHVNPFDLYQSRFELGGAPGHFHLNINPLLRR